MHMERKVFLWLLLMTPSMPCPDGYIEQPPQEPKITKKGSGTSYPTKRLDSSPQRHLNPITRFVMVDLQEKTSAIVCPPRSWQFSSKHLDKIIAGNSKIYGDQKSRYGRMVKRFTA